MEDPRYNPEITKSAWWERFTNPVAIEETEALTTEQKIYIEEASTRLAENNHLGIWYVTRAKPLGLPHDAGRHDYDSIWMKGEDISPTFKNHLVGLDQNIQDCLFYSQYSTGPHEHSSKVILFPDPQNARVFWLSANFTTPIGTIAYDPNRMTEHTHTWALSKAVYDLFDNRAKTWRLFPFILQATASKVRPAAAEYFDGSINGNKVFKAGNKNQLVGLDFVGANPCKLFFEDPADPHSKGIRREYPDTKTLTEEYTGRPALQRSPNAIGELLLP